MSQSASAAPAGPTRPFYWSVRRELWENRSVYLGPLIAAGVVLFGFLISTARRQRLSHPVVTINHVRAPLSPIVPYGVAGMAIIVTMLIVAMFYCLGALHNERRDRSILFWKSLPVSDLATVLSKAAIPLAVMPAVVFAIVVAMHLAILLLTMTGLLAHHLGVGAALADLPLLRLWLVLLYGLVVISLWYAPVYAWLLLVSAWARRAPFLWAVLPPLALCLIEKIAFDTSNLASLLHYRLANGLGEAFTTLPKGSTPGDPLPHIDLAGFLATPGLWVGLIAAVGLLAAAVWVRRNREPI